MENRADGGLTVRKQIISTGKVDVYVGKFWIDFEVDFCFCIFNEFVKVHQLSVKLAILFFPE